MLKIRRRASSTLFMVVFALGGLGLIVCFWTAKSQPVADRDVLSGGGKGYVYVINPGAANRVIQGFDSSQKIRLSGFGIRNPESILGTMKEIARDVTIDLPDGQKLSILNASVADFSASNFQVELDRAGLVQTFGDEFDTFSWDSEHAPGVPIEQGTWVTNYHWGAPYARDSRTLVGNGEIEDYSDQAFRGTSNKPLGVNPFRVTNGVLQIIAGPAPEGVRPYIWDHQYTSGLISSQHSFSQQYGVFEMRARVPKGRGLWPAFWLVPLDRLGPAELDIMEVLGHETTILYTTWHSGETGAHTSYSTRTPVADMAADFHVYGLDWSKDELKWFFDGVEVGRKSTPSDMHRPMFLIANLAIGGYWPKNPDAATHFPAVYEIDWIRVYRRDRPPQ
jgi:beta-glucanase (GH16 family)